MDALLIRPQGDLGTALLLGLVAVEHGMDAATKETTRPFSTTSRVSATIEPDGTVTVTALDERRLPVLKSTVATERRTSSPLSVQRRMSFSRLSDSRVESNTPPCA
ncbi:hypothetical protein BK022_12830 [Methylorubrum extorquens]|uniref:Uncharacterized protein n=1 Tax=Methylorubrum extorquens TaxID=408 RepID=A0A1S1P5G9_METEX|nr:hypothetical protein BK022_12830 [Methylorubrum extorquens]